jgi:hypothetical protein
MFHDHHVRYQETKRDYYILSENHEVVFTILEINFRLLQLDNVRETGATIDIFQKLPYGGFIALCFALNLSNVSRREVNLNGSPAPLSRSRENTIRMKMMWRV